MCVDTSLVKCKVESKNDLAHESGGENRVVRFGAHRSIIAKLTPKISQVRQSARFSSATPSFIGQGSPTQRDFRLVANI